MTHKYQNLNQYGHNIENLNLFQRLAIWLTGQEELFFQIIL